MIPARTTLKITVSTVIKIFCILRRLAKKSWGTGAHRKPRNDRELVYLVRMKTPGKQKSNFIRPRGGQGVLSGKTGIRSEDEISSALRSW